MAPRKPGSQHLSGRSRSAPEHVGLGLRAHLAPPAAPSEQLARAGRPRHRSPAFTPPGSPPVPFALETLTAPCRSLVSDGWCLGGSRIPQAVLSEPRPRDTPHQFPGAPPPPLSPGTSSPGPDKPASRRSRPLPMTFPAAGCSLCPSSTSSLAPRVSDRPRGAKPDGLGEAGNPGPARVRGCCPRARA